MMYLVFLLVFWGELGIRWLFGLEWDATPAFFHGMGAGMGVLLMDFIAYAIRQFRHIDGK